MQEGSDAAGQSSAYIPPYSTLNMDLYVYEDAEAQAVHEYFSQYHPAAQIDNPHSHAPIQPTQAMFDPTTRSAWGDGLASGDVMISDHPTVHLAAQNTTILRALPVAALSSVAPAQNCNDPSVLLLETTSDTGWHNTMLTYQETARKDGPRSIRSSKDTYDMAPSGGPAFPPHMQTLDHRPPHAQLQHHLLPHQAEQMQSRPPPTKIVQRRSRLPPNSVARKAPRKGVSTPIPAIQGTPRVTKPSHQKTSVDQQLTAMALQYLEEDGTKKA